MSSCPDLGLSAEPGFSPERESLPLEHPSDICADPSVVSGVSRRGPSWPGT